MSTPAEFLGKHGVRSTDAFADYHYAFALYASYLTAAMQQAEDIGDGLYFDENEVCALFACLKEAKDAMQGFRRKTDIPFPEFDPAETIALKGCRLEAGKIIGSADEASRIARAWIADYLETGKNPFCFEVAVYILFLLGEEVNYGFLVRGKE